MSAPVISVVVPVFNLGQYLEETLQSVLDQTYSNFEILVIDDGSTDPATRAVLDGLSRPRTQVIRAPTNQGLARARNLGIQQARGRYLCALDADDKLGP